MSRKPLSRAGVAELTTFVGSRSLRLLLLGVVTGVLLAAVELAFADTLQAFLVTVGALSRGAGAVAAWGLEGMGLGSVLALILAVGLLRAGLNYAAAYMNAVAFQEFRRHQWNRLLEGALHAESVNTANLTTLLGERVSNAAILVRAVQTSVVQAAAALFLGVSLVWLAPLPTVAALGALALLAIPVQRLDRDLNRASEGLSTEWASANRRLFMTVRNLLLVQIYGTQNRESDEIRSGLDRYHRHFIQYCRVAALKFALPQALGLALICALVLALHANSSVAPGQLVAYVYLFFRFVQNLGELARTSASFTMYGAQFRELLEWKAVPRLSGRADLKPPAVAVDLPIGWKLSEVRFTYPGAKAPVLEALTCTVDPGQALVITGASGAGKSTVLGLLLGVLRPDQGSIVVKLGNEQAVPLEQAQPTMLAHLGYVGAETFLIDGTVRENLVYGLERMPTEDEIAQASQLAECQFIRDLPLGLDHRLTEQGQGLSAGQKQRLSLARALLRRPRALLLDEVTSNLDAATEERLVDTLTRLKGGLTIIAVTHRRGLLRLADRVLELGVAAPLEP